MGIDISPDGKFVYAVIRQVDAIVVFARDAQTGVLTRVPGHRAASASAGGSSRTIRHRGRVCRRAGDVRHHRHHVGPGGTHLYTVSDQATRSRC